MKGAATRRSDRARFFYPLLLSIALLAVYWFLRRYPGLVNLRSLFGKDLPVLLFIALIPLVFLFVRALDSFAFDVVIGRRRGFSVPQLLRDIVSLGLYFVLFATISQSVFNASLTGFLTTGAVVGAILALALQETLGNLFSGIAIATEASFSVGDVIRSGEFIGTVEAVTWRSTRIRTFNNNIAVLPNSVIARDRLEIYPRGNPNARLLTVPIDYHIPPSAAIEVLEQAASHVEGVAQDMPCIARVASFNDSGVTYEIKYFMRNYADRDRIDATIRRGVWYALRRNHMTLPFPIRSFQPYTPPATEKHELDRDAVLERLRHIDLLSPLSDADHMALAEAAAVHSFSKGETVIRRGAAGRSMFVIARGTVSVHVPDADVTGGSHELARLEEGAVFGEMALLTGEVRTADVVAVSDVTAIEIDKHALQPVLAAHPQLAAALSHKVAERRGHIDSVLAPAIEEEETSLLSRMRTYFGI